MKPSFLFAVLTIFCAAACGTDPVQSPVGSDSEMSGPGDSPSGQGPNDCPDGAQMCGGVCMDVNSNAAHCGSCNNSCGSAACVGGACQCPGGGRACGGQCVEPTDPQHCGGCNNACPDLTQCVNDSCMCAPGLSACNNVCVDTLSDGSNCGQCGNDCGTMFCASGSCTATCPPGTMACGNSCVNTSSSLQHCGACDNVCAAGTMCTNGTCGCPAGQTQCAGGCADTQTSAANCGTCGNACSGGQVCVSGACACPAGQQSCDGSCVDVNSNPLNCGACGTPCAGGQQCSGGVCTAMAACPTGQESCNGACVPAGTCSTAGGATGGGGAGNNPVGTGGSGNPPTPSGDNPPGYWESGDWHGCVWTGVDTLGVGTTISPEDFIAQAPSEPYCVSGSVGAHADYESVALLGFNINEPNTETCEYEPVTDSTPPAPTGMPQADGIAVNFVKQGADTAFTWRVQLQGPNGHLSGEAGAADRWCATITEVQGKVFIPYSDFNTACWDMSGDAYAGEPISAVSFLVPGSPAATPFNFCVNGFAYGTSAADAPDGSAVAGDQTGSVGSSVMDAENSGDFDRAKVLVDDEQYIIQNNNWGNPTGSDCILDYVNNSFTVTSCTGSNNPAPAAFPSIYIGNNGNTAQGVYSTSSTDNLPTQISSITSLPSTFRYSGSAGGSYNAAYDIWFASSPPASEYQDGIDGFVMIWLYDPSGAQPIGSNMGSATIAGMTWNYWVGPRGDGPAGYNDAPVISYVNPSENDNSRAQSFTNKDLTEFFDHAVGLNQGLTANMYLTDVFAGFEIWNGGQGLKVDEFTAVVNK